MIRKILCLLLLWAVFVPIGSAQTIQWLVKPNYDNISRLNNSIFKCKIGDRVQLVDTNGKSLLSSPADSVTDYCENLALVLEKSGDRYKLREIIDESGDFIQVNGKFFVNNYSYFSEGLVSVNDGLSGKAGYLNNKGNVAISCQYRVARPFIKGWASVELAKRQKQTIYIDKDGNVLNIKDFHGGKVIMGSSFNSVGEALVAYYGDDNKIIDTNGKVVREYNGGKEVVPVRSYDFAFDGSGKNNIPDSAPKISFDTEPFPYLSGQLIGYKKADHIVAPPQFKQAGQFSNGCAIVCLDKKYGIVELVEGSFSGEFTGDDLIVAAGKQVPEYTFKLDVPKKMRSKVLSISCDNGNGIMKDVSVDFKNGEYKFIPSFDNNAEVCVMKVQVMSDELLLWAGSMEKNITNVSLDIGLPEAVSEFANDSNEFWIRSVITNNSDMSVIVSGSFYANFAKGSKNEVGQKKTFWHKIKPHSQKEVSATLIVVKEETVKVYVKVLVNQKLFDTKYAVIQVKPFD